MVRSFFVAEKPNKIVIQRVGDTADNIIASAGEDLEMECIATGGNPPPTLRWYADDQEIRSGHTQENSRPGNNVRTWTSISRLTLPVSKADDGATIRCEAEHPALQEPLSARKFLTIHCKHKNIIKTPQHGRSAAEHAWHEARPCPEQGLLDNIEYILRISHREFSMEIPENS